MMMMPVSGKETLWRLVLLKEVKSDFRRTSEMVINANDEQRLLMMSITAFTSPSSSSFGVQFDPQAPEESLAAETSAPEAQSSSPYVGIGSALTSN